jgi:ABC-type transport system involved in cytochrome c biogenesis permease subunit
MMIQMLYASVVLMFVGLTKLVVSNDKSSRRKSYLLLFLSIWHIGYFVLSSYQRYEFFILVLVAAIAIVSVMKEKEG